MKKEPNQQPNHPLAQILGAAALALWAATPFMQELRGWAEMLARCLAG